ncbi:class I SAM-dependent methyltransferase [Candidatus Kuenenbacteria bacterium]|nr:class I SAM-dependent methyltransferase [Candidatus Kuenenbacteria bacterium]
MSIAKEVKFKMYTRNCPVCESNKSEVLFSNPDYRYIDAWGINYKAPLRYLICENCTHIYKNPNIDPLQMRNMYSRLIIEPINDKENESQRLKMHYESFVELTEDFFRELKTPISMIEIGCGNAELLNKIYNKFSTKISSIKGIEPSLELGRQLKERVNFEFENIFFDQLDLSKKYDFIILDNVFEHFDFPHDELSRLRKLVSDTGYLYISIPDISFAIRGFVDMFAGHPSNYVIENFKLLMDKAGFYVEKYDYKYKWLNCLIRLKKASDKTEEFNFHKIKGDLVREMQSKLKSNNELLFKLKNIIKREVELLKSTNGKMLIFGAGDHTQELMTHIDFKNTVIGLIDNNAFYHGKTRLNLKVYSLSQLKELHFDKILISSQSFHQDIKANILTLEF